MEPREVILRAAEKVGIAHNNAAGGQWILVATSAQLDKLAAALAYKPAAAEPVAWMDPTTLECVSASRRDTWPVHNAARYTAPLYAKPQPATRAQP